MEHKYGFFDDEQIKKYKVVLHKDLFWLLLYKDPKTRDEYAYVNFHKYFDSLMRKISGLNELLFCPTEIVTMLSLLEAALIESNRENFDYQIYRKLVLDAHAEIDKIGG